MINTSPFGMVISPEEFMIILLVPPVGVALTIGVLQFSDPLESEIDVVCTDGGALCAKNAGMLGTGMPGIVGGADVNVA